MPEFRMLLVEDDEDTREALAAILVDRLDVDVETANDGREAQRRLRAGRSYDLVLTDERMPGMFGSDLLRWLRGARPEVHRALMTAYQDGPEVAKAAGAEAFLRKPVEVDELVRELRSLMREGL